MNVVIVILNETCNSRFPFLILNILPQKYYVQIVLKIYHFGYLSMFFDRIGKIGIILFKTG